MTCGCGHNHNKVLQSTYNFYSDAGHGWLKVPKKDVEQLGIKITNCSYEDKDFYYLEEDLDAPTFVQAYKLKNGGIPQFNEIDHGDRSSIRNLPRVETVYSG